MIKEGMFHSSNSDVTPSTKLVIPVSSASDLREG